MKNILYSFVVLSMLLYSCGSQHKTTTISNATEKVEEEVPVRIANDSLEYEIIIFDIGFTTFLKSAALPMSYYSQNFLETRNNLYVIEWNQRAQNSSRYDFNIYENVIDYQRQVNYGLEVNYKLFWYFQFAQRKYGMRLSGFRVYGPTGSVMPYQQSQRPNN